MVIILSIEGVHGVGKTEATKKLESEGYAIMKESKITKTKTNLPSQSFYSQLLWITSWFTNLESLCEKYYDKEKKCYKNEGLIITDRSALSGVIYSEGYQKSLLEVFLNTKESFENKGIVFKTVCLFDKKERIWKSITERLEREPWRKKIKEGDKTHFDTKFIEYMNITWQARIHKNYVEEIKKFIKTLGF